MDDELIEVFNHQAIYVRLMNPKIDLIKLIEFIWLMPYEPENQAQMISSAGLGIRDGTGMEKKQL